MARRSLPFVTDHYYHAYNRGVEARPVFTNRGEYQRFLDLVKYYRFIDPPVSYSKFKRYGQKERKKVLTLLENKGNIRTEIVAFCLMPNHFHFLLKQNEDGGISRFLRDLQNSYTKYFNIKHERIGFLFQGAFKSVLVDNESQLLHLSRYIHLNPYSSAIVGSLKQLFSYPWSSLPEYLSKKKGVCQTDVVLSAFSSLDQYKKFVSDRSDYQKQLENIKHLAVDG